jgi:hypothetical protein
MITWLKMTSRPALVAVMATGLAQATPSMAADTVVLSGDPSKPGARIDRAGDGRARREALGDHGQVTVISVE